MAFFASQNAAGEGAWVGVPSAPTNLASTGVDAAEVDLTWDLNDPIEGVFEYRITIQSYENPANRNDGTVQPFTAGHYTAGTSLSIYITAVNASFESAPSNEITVESPAS